MPTSRTRSEAPTWPRYPPAAWAHPRTSPTPSASSPRRRPASSPVSAWWSTAAAALPAEGDTAPGLRGQLDPALDLAGEGRGQGLDVLDQGVEVDRADHAVGAVAQDGEPVAAAGQERVDRDRVGDAGVVGHRLGVVTRWADE